MNFNSSQCIQSIYIKLSNYIQYIIEENLENIASNFERVRALNNLREKWEVFKLNFPKEENHTEASSAPQTQ